MTHMVLLFAVQGFFHTAEYVCHSIQNTTIQKTMNMRTASLSQPSTSPARLDGRISSRGRKHLTSASAYTPPTPYVTKYLCVLVCFGVGVLSSCVGVHFTPCCSTARQCEYVCPINNVLKHQHTETSWSVLHHLSSAQIRPYDAENVLQQTA